MSFLGTEIAVQRGRSILITSANQESEDGKPKRSHAQN
jgi:hypothetical protein